MSFNPQAGTEFTQEDLEALKKLFENHSAPLEPFTVPSPNIPFDRLEDIEEL